MHGCRSTLRCINVSGGTNDDVLTISRSTVSLDQTLVCEPFLNQVGNLAVVLSIISMWELPLIPTSGRLTTSTFPPSQPLFDHLVGACNEGRWHCEA